MKYTLILFFVAITFFKGKVEPDVKQKPVIAFSFDDGNPNDILNYKCEDWNAMIVATLKKYHMDAAWFVEAKNMNNARGKLLLHKWNAAGNLIANHTYSHLNYNDEEVSIQRYEDEILQCDSFIHPYTNYSKLFRFPYLKAGNSEAKKDSILAFLKHNGYK